MRSLQIKTFTFLSVLTLCACEGGGETPYGGREGEDEGGEGEAEGEGMAICGDGNCNGTESCMDCPDDCQCEDLNICGDGVCSEARCETCARCPEDCGACQEVTCNPNDGVCDNYYCGETCENSMDCGACSACGDEVCTSPYESCADCQEDCGPCLGCGDGYCLDEYAGDCSSDCDSGDCGDGVCVRGYDTEGLGYAENCSSCPEDCGICFGCGDRTPACPPEDWFACIDCPGYGACGDLVCNPESGEHCGTCPSDCTCTEGSCGDGHCWNESCTSCPEDCGACYGTCGDGLCLTAYNPGGWSDFEDCRNCSVDCGPCPSCGDGNCDTGETCESCAEDCGTCNTCGDGVCRGSYDENWQSCLDDCSGPQPNAFRCGNGVCEPGEDERCGDCGGAPQTCDLACASSCDCEQPWSVCGSKIGGKSPVCAPLRCEICFGASQYCCWCPRTVCGNVTCGTSEADCPPC